LRSRMLRAKESSMLTGALVTSNAQLRKELASMLSQIDCCSLTVGWPHFPTELEIGEFADHHPRSVLFVDVCDGPRALGLISYLQRLHASVEVIAITN